MTGEKNKLTYTDERELVLETSLEDRLVDDRKIDERAAADTESVMDRHRAELRTSILEMTKGV
jgi:hypothetical protein